MPIPSKINPGGVEDIFADVGPAPEPDPERLPQPKLVSPVQRKKPLARQSSSNPKESPEVETEERMAETASYSGEGRGKLMWIIIIILVVIVLLIGGWSLYRYTNLFSKGNEVLEENVNRTINLNVEVNNNSNTAAENLNQAEVIETPADNVSQVDSDKDGLTDEVEKNQYQTDPQKADTDKDGLTDREEIKVYLTDPLNPDTDGDGFSDGKEIEGLYNPLGPGKLLNLNEAIKDLNK